MEILEQIKTELEVFNKKRQESVETLRNDFPKLLKPLFDKSKLIDSVGWTEYTPYFNDGEECHFSVGDMDYVNGEYIDDIEWYSWKHNRDNYKKELERNTSINFEECQIVEEFRHVLRSIPDEFYRDLFGDHCLVTVSRDGTINISHYDHD